MECKDFQILINAFIDNELDLKESLEVEHHINECRECNKVYQNYVVIRTIMNNPSLHYSPDINLVKEIHSSIRSKGKKSSIFQSLLIKWRGAAIAFALTTIILISVLVFHDGSSMEEQIREEVVDNHIRSLMPQHLTDVLSSDKHTVKPYFNGRLDFSPPVVDLTKQGFPLIGGRIDYISARPVASIIYMHGHHYINLFIWLSDDNNLAKKVSTSRGYNLIEWISDGKTYWAISDLNLNELDEFVSMIKKEL